MKRTKEMKKEWIAELKKMQKSYQGEISPDDLPFDLTAELGVPNKALLAKRILLCSLFAGKETG